jgi:hypothetical protein
MCRYQVDRVSAAWFKDLGPSKDSAYMLSAVANLTSAFLCVPFRQALALSQLCSPLATPWVSGELDFPQHRNLILYIVPPRLGSYCIADYCYSL